VLSALSVLGLGKVPVSVMGMSLCFSWAGAGVALTALLRPWLQTPALFFPLAAAGAAVASVGVTSCLARVMAAYMPKSSSFHQRTEDLEGAVGEALYTIPVDAEGVIRVRDRHGSEVQFSAFIKAQEPVPAGACVLLLRYDAARHAFLVEQAPPELKASKSKPE
jgi:membrane protein implicated in regulation of membrane protease activity